jgi:shikimate dehydrogenase
MTPRFAVIGNPVAHSRSPEIHAAFSEQTGIRLSYERLLAPLDGFRACVFAFRSGGGCGANVTLPFKLEGFDIATQVSERARQAGAVNTLKFSGLEILGENTDGAGLVRDIRDNLGFPLEGKRVLLVGAGGAARGVIAPLLAERPEVIALSNRTFSRAEQVATQFRDAGNLIAVPLAELPSLHFDIIINATSASLDSSLPVVPRGAFGQGSLAYDMMYGKGLTPFMQMAQQAGAKVADGLGMLVEQAAESFMIWHGIRPRTDSVLAKLRQSCN